MMTRFHIVKYIEGLTTGKGRNVAILAFDGMHGQYRTIGVEGKETEPAYFQSIARNTPENEWVFREWAHWLESLAQIRDVDQFDHAISRLKSSKAGFVVSGSGNTDISKEKGYFDVTMDRLFEQYIQLPTISPEVLFENQLVSIFNRIEIDSVQGHTLFDEPVVVEMESEESGEVVTLEFSHLFSGEYPIGFNTLILQGVRQDELIRRTDQIEENFKNAVLTGYLEPDRCVLLCGNVKEKHRDLLGRITGVARVMEVFDESTPAKINEMIWQKD